jgi:pimeloyl-ACP methyl ester carboxylesterase
LRETDLRAALEELKASGRFKCPVAIFQSERDGIVRAENAAYLKSIFPQASVTMVPGSEHALPIIIPEAIDAAVSVVLNAVNRS